MTAPLDQLEHLFPYIILNITFAVAAVARVDVHVAGSIAAIRIPLQFLSDHQPIDTSDTRYGRINALLKSNSNAEEYRLTTQLTCVLLQ